MGIAVRSRITLDLPLSRLVWKAAVGEEIEPSDMACFDVTGWGKVVMWEGCRDRLCEAAGAVERVRTSASALASTDSDTSISAQAPAQAQAQAQANTKAEAEAEAEAYLRAVTTEV